MDIILEETHNVKTKGYWRRRNYQLPPRRKLPVLKLGGQDQDHHHRCWKLKKSAHKPKLRVLFNSPIRLLVKIREAYINMKLNWARKMGMGRMGVIKRKHARPGMIDVGGQQVDARLVMEIYNRMVTSRDQNQETS